MDTLQCASIAGIESVTTLSHFLSSLSWPVACCVTAIIITGMILRYMEKNPGGIPKGKYVLNTECDSHVIKLQEDINNWFGLLHSDFDRLQKRIDAHIDKGQK